LSEVFPSDAGVPSEPALSPRLKLFFSADIIGSTAYKQPLFKRDSTDVPNLDWSDIIAGFYTTITDAFLAAWNQQESITTGDLYKTTTDAADKFFGTKPRYWKTVGDEVIFWKELTGDLQAWIAIACWIKAISETRRRLRDEMGTRLDIKSTIWCAGFPVRNRAIAYDSLIVPTSGRPIASGESAADGSSPRVLDQPPERTTDPKAIKLRMLNEFYTDHRHVGAVDFIGPGIDIGFRLGSLASSKKLIISIDVAYILALSSEAMKSEGKIDHRFWPDDVGPFAGENSTPFVARMGVYFGGTQILKGVLGDIKYPIFWINVEKRDSLDQAYANLNDPRRKFIDWEMLRKFCVSFYEDRRNFVDIPFIYDQTHTKTQPPPKYDELLAMVAQRVGSTAT
jgi:hypothetical protein